MTALSACLHTTVRVALVMATELSIARQALACQTTTCAKSDAPACVRDPASLCLAAGAKVSWWQACTSFSLRAEGIPKFGLDYAATEMLVTRAFDEWTSVDCGAAPPSILVTGIGPIECDRTEFNPEGPNSNAVLFREGGWVHDGNALALTTVTYQKTSGKIVDADMEVNLDHPAVTQASLAYVLTHEAGHFLGLDHSSDVGALMYAQYTPEGRAGGALGADDVRSICGAYPQRPLSDCNFAPETGYDTRCGGDLSGGCAFRTTPRARRAKWLWIASLGSTSLLLMWMRHSQRRRAPSVPSSKG